MSGLCVWCATDPRECARARCGCACHGTTGFHRCSLCGCRSGEPDEIVSRCAAVWHIYEAHPEAWRQIVGDRRPREPDPRVPGIREMILAGSGGN